MDNKQTIALVVVAVVAVAAIGGFLLLNNNNNDSDAQTVNMGFYAGDVKCKEFLDDYFVPLIKEKYNTDVTYESYGPVAAQTVKEEMDAGVTTNGKFDLIWGDISPIATMVPGGQYTYMYDQDWVSGLSNSQYLSSGAEDMVTAGIVGYKEGTAMEFSNGQTMLIFNTDFNAYNVTVNNVEIRMPYNCITLLTNGAVTGFLKVAPAGSGSTYTASVTPISTTGITTAAALQSAVNDATAYDIDTVRNVIKQNNNGTVKGALLYGLPTNFTELYQWVQIYEGQFTYPDPANTAATFHSNLLFQAMIFELTWNSTHDGWTVAADRTANYNTILQKITSGSITTQAQFDQEFGYLYEYLEDLDPYTNKEIGYISTGYIGEINGKVVGANNDTDYSDSTVMIAMTTVTSVDMRTDSYNFPMGAFSLDTGAKSQYYITIPANSSHKEAAMTVANELNDPAVQAKWFEMTGNGYNIDTSKTVSGDSADIYDTYFGFTADWSLYLSGDRLAEVTVNGVITGLASYMVSGWTSQFRTTA